MMCAMELSPVRPPGSVGDGEGGKNQVRDPPNRSCFVLKTTNDYDYAEALQEEMDRALWIDSKGSEDRLRSAVFLCASSPVKVPDDRGCPISASGVDETDEVLRLASLLKETMIDSGESARDHLVCGLDGSLSGSSVFSRHADAEKDRTLRIERLEKERKRVELGVLRPALLEDFCQADRDLLKRALATDPLKVLAEIMSIRISSESLRCLNPGEWLNDEVINFTLALLSKDYSNVHIMKTFFYTKLMTNGYNYSGVRRWTRKVDVFSKDKIVVPVHLGSHWALAVINFRDKSLEYYDSLGGTNPACVAALRQYAIDESMDKRSRPLPDGSEFTVKNCDTCFVPRQRNFDDCGMFACVFADVLRCGSCGRRTVRCEQK